MDDSGEADNDGTLRAGRTEHVRARQVRDIVRYFEESFRRCPTGVHYTLGDTLAMKVGKLLDQGIVLQQDWPAHANSQAVVVVVDRVTLVISPVDAIERRIRCILYGAGKTAG